MRSRSSQLITGAAPETLITFVSGLDEDVRVSLTGDFRRAQFDRRDSLFLIDPSAADRDSLRRRDRLVVTRIRYEHSTTAHDLGSTLGAAAADDDKETSALRLVAALPHLR
jgi:hypothetical protein